MTKTFRIYSDSIGREGTEHYKPREDYGTIEARNELDALDKVAEKLEVTRIRRTRSIPILGVGSIKVEEVVR